MPFILAGDASRILPKSRSHADSALASLAAEMKRAEPRLVALVALAVYCVAHSRQRTRFQSRSPRGLC